METLRHHIIPESQLPIIDGWVIKYYECSSNGTRSAEIVTDTEDPTCPFTGTINPRDMSDVERQTAYDRAWETKAPVNICTAYCVAQFWGEEDQLIAAEPKADDLTDAFRQGFQVPDEQPIKWDVHHSIDGGPCTADGKPMLTDGTKEPQPAPPGSKPEPPSPPPPLNVCRYAKPVLIELPAVKDGDGYQLATPGYVSCEVPESALPKSVCDGSSERAIDQAVVRMLALEDKFQAEGRGRISRLAKWPFCDRTQRNVSIVWIEDKAHWQCGYCVMNEIRRVASAGLIVCDPPAPEPKPRLVWVDSHLELKS